MKVFLDASVLVAAALSASGGSFLVISEANARKIELVTSRRTCREAERNIQEKYPSNLPALYHLLSLIRFSATPPRKLVSSCNKVIDKKDAPILAGTLHAKADILLTLDKEHFLNNQLIAKAYPILRVITPGMLIQERF